MTRRSHVAQYYAEDKDLFDMFMSGKRRFDVESLVELGRRRGILLSLKETREALASYLSRLLWTWQDLQELLARAESPDRREKLTSSRFESSATMQELQTALEAMRTARESKLGELFSVKSATTDQLILVVRYSEFDPSRTRLQQRVEREITLRITHSDGTYLVRHQANDRAKDVATALFDQLVPADGSAPPKASEISLAGIAEPERRTDFFIRLMSAMPGYELKNVTQVSIDRVPDGADEDGDSDKNPGDDDTDDDKSDDDDDEDQSDSVGSATMEAATMLGEVQKAVFEGRSLLASKEFQRLKEDGFFLSRAVWRTRDRAGDQGEIELEADFAEPKACTGFRYSVRGVYEPRTRGDTSELKKTRAPIAGDVEIRILQTIEEAAAAALESIVADVMAGPTTVAASGSTGPSASPAPPSTKSDRAVANGGTSPRKRP